MDRYVLDKMHSSIKVSYFPTGIMIIYKIFIIILGLFLSYETWKFTFEEINDSRFAALSIFNTSVKNFFFNWKKYFYNYYFNCIFFKGSFINCNSGVIYYWKRNRCSICFFILFYTNLFIIFNCYYILSKSLLISFSLL